MIIEILFKIKTVLILKNGEKANFHFWDALCIKIFGKTANECRQELIAVSYLYYNYITK